MLILWLLKQFLNYTDFKKYCILGFPGGTVVKIPPAMQETQVWSLSQEDPLEKGIDNPLKYSCLENSTDRGVWWATVHGATESWTWLSD